ncbi:MAG: protein kinase domain-containing protein [Polyangiaceae bacterium]
MVPRSPGPKVIVYSRPTATFVTRSEQLKGARLGAYEIVRLLGHGSSASVFEGLHVPLGRPVAIKLLHEHLADDPRIRNRFLREGQVIARLRHPNIVEALDVGVFEDLPYLVMELLVGGDLRAYLGRKHSLPVEDALALLLPVAAGLAAAHAGGVVHRDVKPANVFLAEGPRGDVVPKLLDFGLSKLTLGMATSSLTEMDGVAGTALYMAPEQTQGVKFASAASDQYSLAAIVYEALTGRPPFAGEAMMMALLERIRTEPIRPPSAIDPSIPGELDAIVMRALGRDPAARHPGVAAFGAALLPFADARTAAAYERELSEAPPAPRAARVRTGTRPLVSKAAARVATAPGRAAPSGPQSTREGPGAPPSERADAQLDEARAIARRRAVPRFDPDAPLPCAPGESPFHIKGMPYRGVVRFIEKAIPGGLPAFCDALPDERLRAFMRQPFLATGRYDVLPMVPLFSAVARMLGAPFEDFVRQAAAMQCAYDAKTVFRMLFRGHEPGAVAERYSRLNGTYYDFGRYSGTALGPARVVLETDGVPAYLFAWFGPMHLAYAEEAVRVTGARSSRSALMSVEASGKSGPYPLVRSRGELSWNM